jgi:hypothetical protein
MRRVVPPAVPNHAWQRRAAATPGAAPIRRTGAPEHAQIRVCEGYVNQEDDGPQAPPQERAGDGVAADAGDGKSKQTHRYRHHDYGEARVKLFAPPIFGRREVDRRYWRGKLHQCQFTGAAGDRLAAVAGDVVLRAPSLIGAWCHPAHERKHKHRAEDNQPYCCASRREARPPCARGQNDHGRRDGERQDNSGMRGEKQPAADAGKALRERHVHHHEPSGKEGA